MHRPLVPVAEVTPNTKNWTTKVLVIQKLSPRQSQSSPKKYQRFLFIDKDGTKVQAVIYSPDMSLMQDVLQLQETYHISNAKVTFVEPKYRMVPNMYQWIISRTTVIRRVIDDSLPRELGAPEFKKFVDIPLFLNSNSMIAIVVDKLEQRSINTKYGMSTIQEFVLVNDERKPMLLTLWNEVIPTEGAAILDAADKMPIIAATRLHVTDYNGISLSARGFANIIVNPSYSETQSLRTWYQKNHVFLSELVREKKYLKRSSPHQNIPRDSFSSIANVITNNVEDKFWVKVTATIMDVDKKYWYMACDNCLKGTTGEYGWEITCNFCRAETIARPRTKFAITFSDGTTQLDVVIFGDLAENLLGITALELMKNEDENKKLDCDAINKCLNGRRFIVQIKKKTVDTHYGIGYNYNVSSLIEEDVDEPPKVHVEGCSSSHSHVVDLSTVGTDPNAHLLQSSNDLQDVASSSVSLETDK
ncbi:hypothetical protein Salat_2550300 [Sesamum alatum]|uniref:Uncharacterized protein n=1 Tax=Sesamum alatum TaxID=300844 RepID=A0AAE1XSP6_9LAMI|nr:hypothetical protein Salat_2550300 [Sesamum alatum]